MSGRHVDPHAMPERPVRLPEPRANGPDVRPMLLRRFATLWECEAEWEPSGRMSIYIYEPLRTEAPATMRPHCCYGDTVIFYDPESMNEVDRASHYRMMELSPHLVAVDGHWWEITHGKVVRRSLRWCMQWEARRNTRVAVMANEGMRAYRDPELAGSPLHRAARRLGKLLWHLSYRLLTYRPREDLPW